MARSSRAYCAAVVAAVLAFSDQGDAARPLNSMDDPAPPAKSKARAPRKPAHADSGKEYQGREIAQVMSYLGADWLIRPERVDEEQPEKMLDALAIEPGMTVADVGAGVGYHSLKLSRRVGPKGRVFATDVQPEMISMLKSNLREADIKNVHPILCSQNDTKLPESAVDLILMVDVYHEMSNPELSLRGLRKALKPGGRLVLVEFRGEDAEVPIRPEHKMTVVQVRKELEPLGFEFSKLHDFLPWQHILVFEKPRVEKGPSKNKSDEVPAPRQR